MPQPRPKRRKVEPTEKHVKLSTNPNHIKSPPKRTRTSSLAKEETTDVVEGSRSETSDMSHTTPRSLSSSSSTANTTTSLSDSSCDKPETSNRSHKPLDLSDFMKMTLEELHIYAQSQGLELPGYKPNSILPGQPELEFENSDDDAN